jgi:hypothetical protein
MAGNGGGGGDVIFGGECCGGGEGGTDDPDMVIESGGGAGAIEEEGEFVLRADAHGGKLSNVGAILRCFLFAPQGDGGLVEADGDAANFEAGGDDGGPVAPGGKLAA